MWMVNQLDLATGWSVPSSWISSGTVGLLTGGCAWPAMAGVVAWLAV